MKKVLIITSSLLPIPAVDGGAVESLTENILNFNEKNTEFEFVSYSVKPKSINYKDIKDLKYSKFRFIEEKKIKSILFKIISKLSGYNFPDYFTYLIYKDLKKRKEKFDCILIENKPRYSVFFKKKCNCKIILHLHNDWLNSCTRFSREIANSCDKIIVVSNYIKQRVLTIKNNLNVKVVLNGIETERFKKNQNEIDLIKLRKKYNIEKDDFVYIFIGKLKYDKGALEAVSAFSNLSKKYDNIKLLMIGSSFNKDAKETTYIKQIKNIVNKDNNIIFTGFIDYKEVQNLYSLGQVQIVPSIFDDPCPLVVLEGMSMGLPIIATKSGGIPEEVNEKCAILIDKGKNMIKDLATSMEILFNDSNLLENMKKESTKRSELFTNEKFCRNFIDEIKD